nr:hypothetical protein [uncultured Agathobaculum sp.]
MTKGKWDVRKLVAAGVLLVVGLVSFFWLAKTTADPAFHAASIAALDEKKVTVMELTAATAAGSVAISAVPGDATTPIANQISELSGYLLIVVGAIMLEKLLLSLTCYAAFQFLIPIACVLGIVYLFAHIEWCRVLARKLALFGIVICLIVPASIQVTRIVDETFQIQQTVDDAEQAVEQPADTEEEGSWFSQIGEAITGTVSDAVDQAEAALSRFIDAVAALLITTCVIPIAVLLFFVWVTKLIFGIEMKVSSQAARMLPRRYRKAIPARTQKDERREEE